MRRVTAETPDGREIAYYLGTGPVEGRADGAPVSPPRAAGAGRERRWDAESGAWVLYAQGRQERPTGGAGVADAGCPLCPGEASGSAWHEVDRADFRLAVFENRFPPVGPTGLADLSGAVAARRPSAGQAEVVLYTPRHEQSLGDLDDAHLADLVRVWADRTRLLLARPGVRYVFAFENRGTEVGATLTHPHGQIYALPFVPPRLRALAARERSVPRAGGPCSFCRTIEAERSARVRVVDEEAGWVAYVPFAARMPYQLTLAPQACVARLDFLPDGEAVSLGRLLGRVARRYDALFGAPLPYMLAVVQGGRTGTLAPGHLRLSLEPVRRAADRLKYLASSEILGGLYLVDLLPETMADRLRRTVP